MMPFLKHLAGIESFLKEYYQLSFSFEAVDFLTDHHWEKEEASTAGVILKHEQDLEIGIYFHESIIAKSNDPGFDPFLKLTSHHLDTFWILVEEISHFLLIVQRAEHNRKVSQIELEWQADIDKILISAVLCEKQYKSSYLKALVQKLFFETKQISSSSHYADASKKAWQFLSELFKKHGKLSMDERRVQEILRDNYHAPFHLKRCL